MMTKIQNNFSVLNYNEIVYNDLKSSNTEYLNNPYILFLICTDKNSIIYNYIIAVEHVDDNLQVQYSIARQPINKNNIEDNIKNELDIFVLESITTILKEKYVRDEDNDREINFKESST